MENIERLLVDIKESLERDINGRFDRMDARFDAQAMRLERVRRLESGGNQP